MELTADYRLIMDRRALSDPDRRWSVLLHALFAVTLTVPTVIVTVDGGPGLPATWVLAAGFAAWYVALFARPQWRHDTGRMLFYAVGALVFFTALNARDGAYFLLLYALLPQFFSTLPRWAAVLGVAAIVVLPVSVQGGLGVLLADGTAAFNLLASVGLGLVVTAVIEALESQGERQRTTIAELEEARADNQRLLDAARRDVRDRDALARAGHGLIAARTPDDVVRALSEHLAEHSAAVRGVALLTLGDEASGTAAARATVVASVPGTASPPPGAQITLPRRAPQGATVLGAEQAGDMAADVPGVASIVLLPLHTGADDTVGEGPMPPGDADLLWLGLGVTRHDAQLLRDLSTAATEAALALANQRLAAHASRQGRTTGVLAERQRLAHEIHDTLAQGFASIVTQLEAAEQARDRDPAALATHVERAKRTARDSLAEARRTVVALRPQPLDGASLPEALRAVVARWRDAQPSAPRVSVVIDGAPARPGPSIDAGLLRVAQEALTNVGKHAAAGQVTVTLSYLDDLVLLDVHDDGVGFAVDDVTTSNGRPAHAPHHTEHGGYGLVAMRERLGDLGGALVVESAPGEGTTIAARVPLSADTPR